MERRKKERKGNQLEAKKWMEIDETQEKGKEIKEKKKGNHIKKQGKKKSWFVNCMSLWSLNWVSQVIITWALGSKSDSILSLLNSDHF